MGEFYPVGFALLKTKKMEIDGSKQQILFKRGTEALLGLRGTFDNSCLSIDCPWLYDEVKQTINNKTDEKSIKSIQLQIGF